MSYAASAPEIAVAAGKSCRAVEKAFAKAASGKPVPSWLGQNAKLIAVHGRGGRAGFQYKVLVNSVTLDLQDRLKAYSAPAANNIEGPCDEATRRLNIIAPIIAHPKGTPERRAARAAVLASGIVCESEETIDRWVRTYDAHGFAGLARKRRVDKGVRKVLISLAAEQAIPFDDEAWEDIATTLQNYIRGHWKANATLKLIQAHTNVKFRELIEAAGIEHCHTLPDSTFIVPRRFIEAERKYRNVAILRKDRKRYEYTRYRIRRDRAGLRPMEWVLGDVHPVDIRIQREDGSIAFCRMIAWLDVATHRFWFDLVLCEPGTGIRNADVIKSFLAMVAAWGLPEHLYIDNGREYGFADRLTEGLGLIAQLRGRDGRATHVVHSLPRNAPGKGLIEGFFKWLELLLQDVEGHAGGDRMNQKSERLGPSRKAYDGTLHELDALIRARLALTMREPLRGNTGLAGKTPFGIYQAAIEAGWQPVMLNPAELYTVFADEQRFPIRQGVISFQKRRWRCDEFSQYFEDKIIALVPKYWPAEELPLLDIKTHAYVGMARPDNAIAFGDRSGAQKSQQANTTRKAAIRALDRSVPDIDTEAESLRLAAKLPPMPLPAPIATLSVSRVSGDIARDMSESPAEREDRKRKAQTARVNKRLSL